MFVWERNADGWEVLKLLNSPFVFLSDSEVEEAIIICAQEHADYLRRKDTQKTQGRADYARRLAHGKRTENAH